VPDGKGPVITPFSYPDTLLNGLDYYVSNTGSDQNDGRSLASAWLTLQHAAESIGFGDTILVAPGTYAGVYITPEYSGSTAGWKCLRALDPANKPVITSHSPKQKDGRNSFVMLYGYGIDETRPEP